MSETVTEVAEPKFVDEMQEVVYNKMLGLINKKNDITGRLNAASGDRSTLVEQITENDTDPEIVAAREARDEAEERLAALVAPKVEATLAQGSEGTEGLEEQIKEIDSVLKPGLSMYAKLYGDEAKDSLPKQARVKGARLSNSGTGGRRIRGFNITLTVDGSVTEFDSFSAAAKWLDLDTVTLQNLFFEAAGNPEKILDAPNKVGFTVTYTDTDEDGETVENTANVLAYRKDEVDPNDDSPVTTVDDHAATESPDVPEGNTDDNGFPEDPEFVNPDDQQ